MSPLVLAPSLPQRTTRGRCARPALALAVLAVTASAAAGQGTAGAGATGQGAPREACGGVVVRPTSDSVTHTVALRVSALDPEQQVPASLTRLIAQGVAQYFVRPANVTMPAVRVVPGERGAPTTAAATLAGEYLVTLRRDGRLAEPRVLATSLAPAFDRAIVRAFDSLATDGHLFELPPTTRGDSALLRLQLVRAEDAAPGDDALVPLLRTRVPLHVVAESAGDEVGAAAPMARGGHARLASFVVDTAGVPVPHTVRVPAFDDAAAVQALFDELPRLRYQPARVAGCRVPTMVSRPIAPDGARPLLTADGRVVYREKQVEHPVALRTMRPPPYPEELKRRNVEGEVLMHFVVDTAGRAIPGTLRVLRANHPLFVDAVRASVVSAHFVPASIGGRPVAQLVQQPFYFRLSHDVGPPVFPGSLRDAARPSPFPWPLLRP